MLDGGIYPCDGEPDLRKIFFDTASGMYAEALELLQRKNADYSPGADPFKNFRRHGTKGVLVRMADKLARLETFEEQGSLANESLKDTCIDLPNYAVIYYVMKQLQIK